MNLKAKRAAKQLAGICSSCKAPATHGRMCQKHAERNAEVTRQVRARKKAAGICKRCSAPAKGYPTYSAYCEKHSVETKMYADDYYQDWHKERVAEFKAAGMCRHCGKRRPFGKRVNCRKCTMYFREKSMNWYNANRRAA